jgi:lysophospholipase L1-like esterase
VTRERRRPVVVGLALVLLCQTLFAALVVFLPADEPPPAAMTIAVVGDSYSAGLQNQVVWPTLLAARTGWAVANFALPDSGYVADGLGGQSFSHQVDRAAAAHPRAIVIVGGIADTELPDTDAVALGARDAINKIKLSGYQPFVVGPTWYATPVPETVRNISVAIQKVAQDTNVRFLDALAPPWLTRDQMQPDLRGPTDDGQSVIADRIAAWLRSQVAG